MKTIAGSVVSRVVAMVIVIAMACPYAYAIGIGKVTYIEGRVDVAGQGSSIATPLREGDPISAGDAIRTKSNSKAEVTFNDKSMLRLAQNTRIEVKDYVLDTNNKRKTAEIMVDRGRARTIIEKMPGLTEFNISTPNAKGTVHGSDIYTSFQAGSSSMLVAEGQLSIINPTHPGKELIVPAGNSVIVPLDETPKGMRPYMDFEKKLQEQETAVPANIVRSQNATILKGVFTKISGDVRVTSKGSENSRKAALSDVLGEGDTIETGNNGVVEISFENGNGMNLQENTRITIIKLIQDPKTKQYDNRFEASMGKVRARIEKLKETKSTFEIKTPTALCGARGTLMYVQITPGSTKVFFEGGVGYLNSLISSMQSTVDAGQSAYADDSGKVSEPKTLSGEERESWGSGWNAGNGTEGYSSEGGTVGIYLESGDTGMGGSLEIVGSTDTNVNDSIVDVPFVPASAIEVIHDSNFNLTAEILYNGTKVGTMDDSEGGLVGSFWNAEKKADFISAGDFNLPDREKEPFVWTPIDDDVLKSRNPDTGSSVTATGGAFYGIAGGIGTATTADGGILEGISKFMYIDPDGNIGTAGGNLNGEYSDSDDIYILTSTSSGLTGKVLPDGKNIGVTAEGMAGSIWTNADNDENDGGDSSDGLLTISLVNYNADTPVAQTWGIYGGRGTGEFQSAPADGIVWHVSGRNSFGAYYDYDSEADKFKYDNGYWLADISDSVAGNKLSGSFSGRFLTGTKMGTIEGVMLGTFGTYDGKILYQAVSTGEWDGEPLTFSGTWLPEASTVYSKGFDGYSEGDFGLIGATTSPWKDQAKFLAIGEYNIDTETPGGAFIWNNFIESYDIITGDSTTIDGGFFYGLTTGVCNKEEVTGSSVAIYVDPDGIAGYLSSGLNGVYYSDNDVWMAEGVFNAEQIANGFNSKTVEISSEPLTVGYPYGDSESNRVKVSSGSGATYFISGKDWGIYRLDFDSEGNYYDRNGTSRTWSATISGSGPFGSGQSLGVMQGDFYGAAVDEGCWIGTVIGKWGKDEHMGRGYYDREDGGYICPARGYRAD
ncbi:MAG: FecR family protein [Candidatus Omnitrophica bacterium]|nr:FecR family protein [Candidatus Omnitrophota bacterium]